MKKKKYLKFLLCMLLSVAMLLCMSGGVIAEEGDDWYAEEEEITDEEITDEESVMGEPDLSAFVQVAQDGNLVMYANSENGYFYLENTATGKQWHSVPVDLEYDEVSKGGATRGTVGSQMIISYVNREEMATVEYAQEAYSSSDSLDYGGVTTTTIDNGIRVEYLFSAVGITVPVTYTVEDGDFYARILTDEIKEEAVDGQHYCLIDVTMLPVMGAGNWATDGFLFVPDGSGALVDFNNGVVQDAAYKSLVYGADMSVAEERQVTYTESIRLPVFGTIIGEDVLMGIITEGDAASSITVVNGNERCGYNAVSSVFHYRVMQAQYNLFNKRNINQVAEPEYGLDSFTVRYTALDGDKADYIGMATEYREYLGLTKRGTTPTFHLETVGAFEQAATFLGIIPYTDRVSLTTYDQAQTILEDLQAAGMTELSLKYTGWSNNGLENKKIPKAANALSVLGGKKSFTALQNYTALEGITLYADADLLQFQKNGNGVSKNKSAVRNVFGKVILQAKYMLSTYVTVLGSQNTAFLSPEQLSTVGERYLKSLQSNNMTAVSLSTLGEYCYSNFYEKNEQYRSTFPQKVQALLQQYADAGVSMSFSGGNAYVLPYASLITDVPLHSSGYDIFCEDVPFYQAVLHGYIPYTTESLPQTGDPENSYLAAVETGTELSYIGIYEDAAKLVDTDYNYLYGSTWSLWKDEAAAQYAEYMPLLNKIYDKAIVGHRALADNVYVTEYEGGVQVAVNYTEADVTVQGQTIPAKSFCEGTWEEVIEDEQQETL